MAPGLSVSATNENGEAEITYVNRITRQFVVNDKKSTVRMIPRARRFAGMMGLYEPASRIFFSLGTRWVVADELINFENQKELDRFLYQGSAVFDWVFTDDGLTVGFFSSPDGANVNVDVFQLFVNGIKPTKIEGSRPDQITLYLDGKVIPTSRLVFEGAEKIPFWRVFKDPDADFEVGLTGVHGQVVAE